jgi:glucose uptake protein
MERIKRSGTSGAFQARNRMRQSKLNVFGGVAVYQPDNYAMALLFMISSMLCWGSWANTVKLAPKYRFQLFYWDYVIGLALGTLAWGLSLGSFGSAGLPLIADMLHATLLQIALAVAGGIIFNAANLLLVVATEMAGLAVAFPIGIGVALVLGAAVSYAVTPGGNVILLFGGIALVLAAILCDAAAYRKRDSKGKSIGRRAVSICAAAGILMGMFYPFVAKAMSGKSGLGPYATAVFFAAGVALCNFPMNWYFSRHPLDGKSPVAAHDYLQTPKSWHLCGLLGGLIWCTGAVLNFSASGVHFVGPAVSYSIGQGATMISAAWGVFVWKEFSQAPRQSKQLLFMMFILFLSGLTAIALAPVF